MPKGTVKRMPYDAETGRGRGYVFLRSEDGRDLFAHASAFASRAEFDELTPGDVVTYDEEPDHGRGPRAANVRVVGSLA